MAVQQLSLIFLGQVGIIICRQVAPQVAQQEDFIKTQQQQPLVKALQLKSSAA